VLSSRRDEHSKACAVMDRLANGFSEPRSSAVYDLGGAEREEEEGRSPDDRLWCG
jgi:hypothetical protein